MRVLLLITNRYRKPLPVMPLGAAWVAESARRAGHAVRVVNFMFQRQPLERVRREIRTFRPDLVGVSIRNIDNNDMGRPVAFHHELVPLMERIRRDSTAPVVIGGAAVGLMPEPLLRLTGADWAVLGNGERVLPALLDALERGEDARVLPDVAWIDRDGYRFNPPAPPFGPAVCPVPDYEGLMPMRPYRARMATVPVQTKRGCPFDCVYCTYAIYEGRDYRLVPPETVVQAVRNLVARGYRDIEFVDNVFNSPYTHALDICRLLATARLPVRLQSVELNPAFLDDPLVDAMEGAGFVSLGISAESASDTVLAGLNKSFRRVDLERAADSVRRSRLPCFWIFLFGGPGETERSARETFRFAEQCIRPGDIAFFNVGLRVYPGTAIERIARAEGSLTRPPEALLEPYFYLSPGLDPVWLQAELNAFKARRMNAMDSETLTLPVVPALYRVGQWLGVRQPLWRHTPILRRTVRGLGFNV